MSKLNWVLNAQQRFAFFVKAGLVLLCYGWSQKIKNRELRNRIREFCAFLWINVPFSELSHKQENDYRGVTLNKLNWIKSKNKEYGIEEHNKGIVSVFMDRRPIF